MRKRPRNGEQKDTGAGLKSRDLRLAGMNFWIRDSQICLLPCARTLESPTPSSPPCHTHTDAQSHFRQFRGRYINLHSRYASAHLAFGLVSFWHLFSIFIWLKCGPHYGYIFAVFTFFSSFSFNNCVFTTVQTQVQSNPAEQERESRKFFKPSGR